MIVNIFKHLWAILTATPYDTAPEAEPEAEPKPVVKRVSAADLTGKTLTDYVRQRYISDTLDHVLEVLHDSGVFRVLTFGKPGTGMYRIAITTWPGHLSVSGDMGTVVFKREHDMIPWAKGASYDYMASKVVAGDIREYSPGATRAQLEYIFESYPQAVYEILGQEPPVAPEDDDEVREPTRQEVADAIDAFMWQHGGSREEAVDGLRTMLDGMDSEWYEYIQGVEDYTFQYLWIVEAVHEVVSRYLSGQVAVTSPL